MKWILATGLLVAVAIVAYSWWRAGDAAAAICEPLCLYVNALERCR